ncbi:phosphodiesterase [Salmonella enterica]|nr:phosphodiesterase [Salmonella enterica]
MKLMFASDIHGSLPATERVLERFAQSGARWLVILGDVLNHGPRNALPEGYVDQMLLHFPITAPWQQILTQERRLFLTHGHLFGPTNLPALHTGDVLVYGHTHLPVAQQQEGLYHFNPGSVSIPKGGYAASYGILDDNVLSVIALNDQSIIAQVAINS